MALGLVCALASAAGAQPSIVVIFSDDAGYNEIGYTGDNPFLTPAIDSIARSGIRFTAGYVTQPICAPSRAGLLLGRYQQRVGFENNHANNTRSTEGLQPGQVTLAHRLRDLGYVTGVVGKWHLGAMDDWNRPQDMGFDEFYGVLSGGRIYWRGETMTSKVIMRGDTDIEADWPTQGDASLYDQTFGRYVTDAFGEEAAAFIDRHAGVPFFLYLPFTAPHSPYQAKSADRASFPHLSGTLQTRAAMTLALDRAVGMVLDALERNDIADETIVVFLNDNGGGENQDNSPFRGSKVNVFEGGVRVPFCVRWPGLPADVDEPRAVSALDLVPTLVVAAGGEVGETDGVDLRPYLTGEEPGEPHEALYFRHLEAWAVNRSGWKLVRPERGLPDVFLFDLASDPGETTDLSAQHPETADALRRDLTLWEATLDKPAWKPGGNDAGLNRFDHFRFAVPGSAALWSQAGAWFREDSLEAVTLTPADGCADTVLEFRGLRADYTAVGDMRRMSGEAFMANAIVLASTIEPGRNARVALEGEPLVLAPSLAGAPARIELTAPWADHTFTLRQEIAFLGELVLTGDGAAELLVEAPVREFAPGGSVVKRGGSALHLRAPVECSGGVVIEAGALRCRGGACTLGAGGTARIAKTGVLALEDGATIVAPVLEHAGRLEGSGVMEVRGSLASLPGAVLAIDIGGHGDGHDQLSVSAGAALAGTLEIAFTGGFEPARGDRFRVVECAGATGGFDAVVGNAPRGLRLAAAVDGAGAWLEVLCLADLDASGRTDIADFIAFLNLWVGGEAAADWNGDGAVNTADFVGFLADWSACRE